MISDNIFVGLHPIQKYLGPRDVMVIFIRSERDLEVGEQRFGLPLLKISQKGTHRPSRTQATVFRFSQQCNPGGLTPVYVRLNVSINR
jgi:hypothetical protein